MTLTLTHKPPAPEPDQAPAPWHVIDKVSWDCDASVAVTFQRTVAVIFSSHATNERFELSDSQPTTVTHR